MEAGDGHDDYARKKTRRDKRVAAGAKDGAGEPCSSDAPDTIEIIPSETEREKPAVFFRGTFDGYSRC